MIYVMGGGGGSAFAFIIVNYPAGSTVTCTNSSGKKDISSTKRLFYVKEPSSGSSQSCVVTATDGTRTATQTVSITEGQSKTITLAYTLYLIKNGVAQVSETKTRVTTSTTSGSLRIMQTEGVHCYLHLGKITIPQGTYSTLKMTIPSNTPVLSFASWGVGFGLSDTITVPSQYSESVYDATKRLGETSTYAGTTQSLAIGSINGQYYIVIDFEGKAAATEGIYVENMWLE